MYDMKRIEKEQDVPTGRHFQILQITQESFEAIEGYSGRTETVNRTAYNLYVTESQQVWENALQNLYTLNMRRTDIIPMISEGRVAITPTVQIHIPESAKKPSVLDRRHLIPER